MKRPWMSFIFKMHPESFYFEMVQIGDYEICPLGDGAEPLYKNTLAINQLLTKASADRILVLVINLTIRYGGMP